MPVEPFPPLYPPLPKLNAASQLAYDDMDTKLHEEITDWHLRQSITVGKFADVKRFTVRDLAALIFFLGEGNCPKLYQINFSCQHLGDPLLAHFAVALPKISEKLMMIDMEKVGATEVGVSKLAQAIGKGFVPALEILCFKHNDIGEVGARAIAAAIETKSVPQLRLLSLNGCKLGDAGATAIFDVLHLAPVSNLNIRENEITDVGFEAMSRCIARKDTALLNVECVGNEMSQEFFKALDPICKAKDPWMYIEVYDGEGLEGIIQHSQDPSLLPKQEPRKRI